MKYLTESFEPKRVLRHFEDICRIPHGSYNEKNLAEHIISLAKENNLKTLQDLVGNIFIQKPASKGYENKPSFLLQGHLDMVCVKEENYNMDMKNEPIKLLLENNILRADKTSLGADNAVGLCNMIEIMIADDLLHPPLEFLFTVQEEVGLFGIRNFDMGMIKSHRMITMDCGDPDFMIIGSAGSFKANIIKESLLEPIKGEIYKISISGLIGGHSGIEIGKNRASAVELLGRVLSNLLLHVPLNIVSIHMNESGNSIPKSIECTIAINKSDIDKANYLIKNIYEIIYKEFMDTEKFLKIEFNAIHIEEKNMINIEDTKSIVDLMLLIPYGVQKRSMSNLNWITCSSLITDLLCEEGVFKSKFAIRANMDELKYSIVNHAKRICFLCNAKFEQYDDFPAWQNKFDSKLQILCSNTYSELFKKSLNAGPIHGCIEAGYIYYNIPNMDIIGIAPKSRGAHTTDEHLYLETMQPFWKFLVKLLENMCNKL
jgi:dipeptidase D